MTDDPTVREFDGIRLQRVRDHVWEIPREGGMGAAARVLASEDLLEQIGDDRTLRQLRNVTHLPGIAEPAVCMPDGHQGYGFPVGGVGATDAETGCISPGSIGYDINCLPADTEVTLSFGRRTSIADLRASFENEQAMVAGDEYVPSDIRLFTESGEKETSEIETATGDTLRASHEHPVRTPDGMRPISELSPGDTVSVQPFVGIEDRTPEEFTVLTAADFADENPQIRRVLDERGILPLRSTDEAFNHLLKIVGYITGDGAFGSEEVTWFYGDPEDLEDLRKDVRAVGFRPSRVYERDRTHDVDGTTFERTEYSFKTTSRALKLVFKKLGAPEGPKVESGFSTPAYLDRLANWQRALYYSAYFGAEMSTPAAQHDKNLYCPKVSQTRTAGTAAAGETFLRDMASFLSELGIETNNVERFETDSNERHETVRLRLGIKNDSENLIRFFSRVGYRYNRAKRRAAAKAIVYLKRKEHQRDRRARIAADAKVMADGGMSVTEIKQSFEVNDRFIERSIWGGRDGDPRPGQDFPGFEAFCDATEVGDDFTVPVTVESTQERAPCRVYDIGVAHEAHNFVADGFVVSNCGVRMVRTNLTYDDLKGREAELVDALFANVPSGLGGGGIVETDRDTVAEILDRGVEWALDNGYAVPADLDHCEDGGRRPDADPDAVSEKAKDRGRSQVGSLGSGNHFLEVQRVTDVYRPDVADAYGLAPDRIVVLIHCGSRGLGHQVCSDYLREIEREHADLLAELPDKELAAAPAGSELAEDYYGAMCAAINFAWVNRQLITHRTRRVFERVFDREWEDLGMELLYDVAHNIGKKEVHEVPVDADGRPAPAPDAVGRADRELYVHRKGATRAFPAGRPEIPAAYRDVGQPVIIPGSMGAGSYVLRGGRNSLDVAFGSTAHGAGRTMSRTQAKDEFRGGDVRDDLRDRDGIYVKAQSGGTVAEEAPGVYKDVDEVVRVSESLGIGDRVARTFPVCNVKG
jgi:tRNA-splicing ligase RtcB